ncbi:MULTISPECIES: sigma-54 interaction domain-containing protein [Fusobacterium]|uniref:sigma-54 interaction domain-containing protein n=1 Tax=Fusobacterium TaxID=848 RepID=UPI001F20D9D3|nr:MULTISPECIES: sigma 54-interacting transcriptional regulator [Fusobacterium]MCF2612893.1 sigma 54-interacting transcriptional regulator [Fusobacterium perfoetens]MDY2981059.1 sigma 54-interacting transcriptional regulator [Fusobacterium sp.]
MNISLIEIEEHIKKYIKVITTVINVDVGVVDKNMKRVSGTSRYNDTVGERVRGNVFKKTIETGETSIIENPRTHDLCQICADKELCKETLEIATPIYCNGEIEGVLGLLCFNEEQKNKILLDVESYLDFTKQIAEFIGMKFKEYRESLLQKEREETLNQLLNNMTKGVILSDVDGNITSINQIGIKKLKLSFNPEGKKMQLISQNDYIMNEEIFKLIIGKKEYNVTGKKVPMVSFSQKKINGFIFDDIQKISKNIVEVSNQYNRITLDDIHGTSQSIQSLKEYIKTVANSNSTVLITGESGTGKELIARSLHSSGNRKDKPLVVINCSAIPDSLLESELFGYVKGAFTGADNNGHMGKFELANGGVIFLDEIGDMPLYLQAKILRVIQEKKIERIGSNKSIDLDIKIIAATNADLRQKIKEKKFREDLFYRLNVIPIQTCPLRERREDIEPIVKKLIEKYSVISGKKEIDIDEKAMNVLLDYDWPGNVRELENVIELIMNTCGEADRVTVSMLPENIKLSKNKNIILEEIKKESFEILEDEFCEIEKNYIIKGLEKYGNSTEGKKILCDKMNIGLTTLYRKLKKFNIDK